MDKTKDSSKKASKTEHKNMVLIKGSEFNMGSTDFYPEERPVRKVEVTDFWIDKYQVTVSEFRKFIDDTGYKTVAEHPLKPEDYPGADPKLLVPGALVFNQTERAVDLRFFNLWWKYVPGANWKHPSGPESEAQDDHPVTQVAFEDAQAYAKWAGKELASEAQWEFAARGGLKDKIYTWGDEYNAENKPMANTWEGEFPHENKEYDGYLGTSPVGTYPENGYGLFDMAGNVWEWTGDFYQENQPYIKKHEGCKCSPTNPRVTSEANSFDVGQPQIKIPRRVIKGGSHLCADNFCHRYRPAARSAQMIDTGTAHIGFRCIKNIKGENHVSKKDC